MSVDLHGRAMPTLDLSEPGCLGDLADAIRACNTVTVKLQRSHDALQGEVVRLKEELARTNEQLQRSKHLAALGQMAAGIAHEVRNPLAAIQLYAGMIAEDLAVPSRGPYFSVGLETARANADKIASAVRSLDAIVGDVLRFAREIRPRCSEVSVRKLVARAVATQRPALDAAGTVVAAGSIPGTLSLHADAELLHQALVNLIRNASEALVEASDESGGRHAIHIEAGRVGRDVVMKVADDGPGIPPEGVDRIFDPFYTTRSTGTGLGLTIVHRIIDAHGGTISLMESGVSGGAVFEICLPAGGIES